MRDTAVRDDRETENYTDMITWDLNGTVSVLVTNGFLRGREDTKLFIFTKELLSATKNIRYILLKVMILKTDNIQENTKDELKCFCMISVLSSSAVLRDPKKRVRFRWNSHGVICSILKR